MSEWCCRETSALEIREMKEKVDIEIETFIHGAMCNCLLWPPRAQ
ncbi:U32 family peptidase [Bacillus sp. SL00103]